MIVTCIISFRKHHTVYLSNKDWAEKEDIMNQKKCLRLREYDEQEVRAIPMDFLLSSSSSSIRVYF